MALRGLYFDNICLVTQKRTPKRVSFSLHKINGNRSILFLVLRRFRQHVYANF